MNEEKKSNEIRNEEQKKGDKLQLLLPYLALDVLKNNHRYVVNSYLNSETFLCPVCYQVQTLDKLKTLDCGH